MLPILSRSGEGPRPRAEGRGARGATRSRTERQVAVAVAILGASLAALSILGAADVRAWQSSSAAESFRPKRGSLLALTPTAEPIEPGEHGCLVLFVLGPGNTERAARYWDRVGDLVAPACRPTPRLWGVCANPGACPKSLGKRGLEVVGFLDPYQMAAVARAGALGRALVYRDSLLVASVRVGASPERTAAAITARLEHVRGAAR